MKIEPADFKALVDQAMQDPSLEGASLGNAKFQSYLTSTLAELLGKVQQGLGSNQHSRPDFRM